MIAVTFKEGSTTATVEDDVYQFDYGQYLRIEGLSLPETIDFDFAFGNTASVDSITVTGETNEGVTLVSVPNDILAADKVRDYTVYVYIFQKDEDPEAGETTYVITMPVKTRPKRDSN